MQFAPVQVDGDGGVNVVFAEAVTGSYFPMLGIEAQLGRTILPEDDVTPGAHPVVMLDHGYWQDAFAADPGMISQSIRIAGRGYEIVGVAPPDYPGSFRGVTPSFYAPLMMVEEFMRLPAQLSAFVLSVSAALALVLATIGLYGVVSFAAAQRTREVGIRMALGADTGHVVRLLASSGLKLVLVGAAIGLAVSLALTRLLRGLLFGGQTLDPAIFLGVPLVLGVTAALAAYLPARRASGLNPVTALYEG